VVEYYLAPAPTARWPYNIKNKETGQTVCNVETLYRDTATMVMKKLQKEANSLEDQFGWDDVLVGDKIKATSIYEDGTEVVVTGVVDRINDTRILSKETILLAGKPERGGEWSLRKIELVERVEPREYIVIGTLKDGTKEIARTSLMPLSEAQREANVLNNTYSKRFGEYDKWAQSTYAPAKVAL
jgi:hypothetical protein